LTLRPPRSESGVRTRRHSLVPPLWLSLLIALAAGGPATAQPAGPAQTPSPTRSSSPPQSTGAARASAAAPATAEDAEAGPEVVEADDEVEEFHIEAAIMDELLQGLAMRTEADMQLDLLSAEDLSKFAASDVADALRRMPGVNIVGGGGVGGQFAIIRGLEDRYSSTTFNGAPVPSPDPTRQSVQLDLFPSEVVSNLAVGKNFVPESPSNSAGGSLDITTLDYPETLTVKLSVGSGFEDEARKRFLKYESGSTVGKEQDPTDIIESDVGGSVGGRTSFLDREVRYKGVVNHEIDYTTLQGFQQTLEPSPRGEQTIGGQVVVTETGGLAKGLLERSAGRFEQTQSTRAERLTGFAGLGIDLDEDGDHKLDATYFHTDNTLETVELRENGYFPGFDYSGLVDATVSGDLNQNVLFQQLGPVSTIESRLGPRALREELTDTPARGALWFANFGRSYSYKTERDLDVYQLNGKHAVDLFEGLDLSWAANYAKTSQDERTLSNRFFYEPCGFSGGYPCDGGGAPIAIPTRFPATVGALGPGTYFASGNAGGIVSSQVEIDERQYFVRGDADQDVDLADFVSLNLKAGFWWEDAKRDVDASFLETVTVGGLSQWSLDAPTLYGLGSTLFDRFDPSTALRQSTTKSSREITAGHAGAKLTFWDDVDLLGGLRVEHIFIDSKNSPFTGEFNYQRPTTFPVAYLFFDRQDNASLGETPARPGTIFNDQILGIDVPVDPDTGFVDLLTREQIQKMMDGEIDETKVLPSAGLAYRPIEGATLRASYSQTVARPSFREMGYYVNFQPGTDEQFLGNPQVGLSEVESFDVRSEYMHGDLGDLVAFSAFYKVIEDPIESIILRNPLDYDSGSSALYRTYFNNPNTARLWGIEIEARKFFDFLPAIGLDFPGAQVFEYLSIGGNFSYIDARVARTEAEFARSAPYFSVVPGDDFRFARMSRKRRLFGQPEWIGNADVSFNHPDWGTNVTLAVSAISDVLDAAGTATLDSNNRAVALTLDRYLDSYYQLDLIAGQEIWRGITLKFSVKNLTNTARRRVYDRKQTAQTYVERTRRQGQDWSIALGYTVDF